MLTNRLFLYLTVLVILLAGCSSSTNNPVNPDEEAASFPNFQTDVNEENTNHNLWGVWSVSFNPDTMDIIAAPSRELAASYNISTMIPAPGIAINDYDPVTRVLDVDVTLNNPYSIDGYDVRLIIYTDNNGHKLVNDDNWTNLFDIPGGFIGNPFKAYAAAQPNRIFAGLTQHTEDLQIYLPPSGGDVLWAVTASSTSA